MFKETDYEARLLACATEICNRLEVRWVMIAGGSCCGKTTTTQKLAKLIRDLGRPVETISLDDYYRNPENAVYLPNGRLDFEGLQSLRLDLLAETMRLLADGKPAPIPLYDFKQRRRYDAYRTIEPTPDCVFLVEGLHALNTAVCADGTDPASVYRIYLYTDSGDGIDRRLLRRLVRDHRHRATDAKKTLAHWDLVRDAEKETIMPFVPLANCAINTYFDYEHSILADDAIAVLKELPNDDPHAEQAKALISGLENVSPLPDDVIPNESLLLEFI